MNRWAAVWRKSRLKLIENKKTDLLWLIIHRAIKVRYALKTWGYKVKSDKCALCSQVETIEHCFLFCPRVRAVWRYFTPCLSRLLVVPLSLLTLLVFSFLSCLMLLRLLFRFIVTWSLQFYFGFGKLGTSQPFEILFWMLIKSLTWSKKMFPVAF